MFSWLINLFSKIFLFTGKLGASKCFSFEKKLPPEKEREYFLRISKAKQNGTTDTEAEEIITKHNLRLVAHIAKKYSSATQTQDDLISIGSIGLIKATRTYNMEKAKNFSSYASRCIENEILMVLRSEKKESLLVSLSSPLGTDPDGNELYLSDTLKDERIDLDRTADTNMVILKIKKLAKEHLDSREYQILSLRFGLDGSVPLTQKETSEKLNISRSYISRLEQCAIKKLKKFF